MDRKELKLAASEIRSCGEMLLGAAERLIRAFEASPAKQTIALQEESLTIEDVRRVLAQKSREGFTAEIRTLLEKHGADRLSKIAPEHYAVLLKEAESIGK